MPYSPLGGFSDVGFLERNCRCGRRPLSPSEQGLRVSSQQQRNLDLPGDDPLDARSLGTNQDLRPSHTALKFHFLVEHDYRNDHIDIFQFGIVARPMWMERPKLSSSPPIEVYSLLLRTHEENFLHSRTVPKITKLFPSIIGFGLW